MKKFKFYFRNRFLLAILFIILFIIINLIYTGKFLPETSVVNFWFYSGLLLLLFSILFIEPFYSSPKNIITNSLPLLISYLAIKNYFINDTIWLYTFIFISCCILLSIISLAIQNENESDAKLNNKIATLIRKKIVIVGEGKVIYSIVFLSVIFLYKYDLDNQFSEHYFFSMIIFWGLILVINPKSLHSRFSFTSINEEAESIGEIFSIQSNNMYLVKLFDDRNDIEKFDLVNFRYLLEGDGGIVNQGIVFDTYKLNSQKWAKVLGLNQATTKLNLSKNVVYKISSSHETNELNRTLGVDRFVGVIIEGSKIGNIKFEYSKKVNDIQEGDLLELRTQDKLILYQVVGGFTEYEKLENKNESGFIEGEALQLGVWNNDNISFEKFGWIPEINTPLFLAKTDNIELKTFELPEFELGNIPNTNLPSVINLNDAVSHHTALLGVTGSGKSFLAKEMITELIKDSNVICIDFTGEYKTDFASLSPVDIINITGLPELEKMFAEKHGETLAKRPAGELKFKQKIQKQLDEYVEGFMSGSSNLGLFELPALSNTSFILEFTQFFIESVFNYAKDNTGGNRICLVLEEAHTIVPETNFLGDLGDYGSSKALVNKMAQIALQGRKFNVGLLVIAQRTANVSKTVLTQCNTVICFQAFDETSFTFLGNYIGKDLVQTLPNLKKYHAIVTGKAIKSNIPMIIDLERK